MKFKSTWFVQLKVISFLRSIYPFTICCSGKHRKIFCKCMPTIKSGCHRLSATSCWDFVKSTTSTTLLVSRSHVAAKELRYSFPFTTKPTTERSLPIQVSETKFRQCKSIFIFSIRCAGDDLYPSDPCYTHTVHDPAIHKDKSCKEIRILATKLHRYELCPSTAVPGFAYYMNIEPFDGHLSPIVPNLFK